MRVLMAGVMKPKVNHLEIDVEDQKMLKSLKIKTEIKSNLKKVQKKFEFIFYRYYFITFNKFIFSFEAVSFVEEGVKGEIDPQKLVCGHDLRGFFGATIVPDLHGVSSLGADNDLVYSDAAGDTCRI